MEEFSTLYFILSLLLLALLGALAHVARAVFNLFPDKISDNPGINVAFSSGYSAMDHFFQIEFDENGYYKLMSRRNMTYSIALFVVFGLLIMVIRPHLIDDIQGFTAYLLWSFGDLLAYRWEQLTGRI